MNSIHLNEHDANQGAQSSGEFLGMTGNSGWYLLGSGGATIMMVIVLWGVLGFSLLLCLFFGLILCLGSVAYVFMLKNNKPEHYDTDFFESALVEAGVLNFRFNPRAKRLLNPFTESTELESAGARNVAVRAAADKVSRRIPAKPQKNKTEAIETAESPTGQKTKQEAVVARRDYDRMEEKLTDTEDMLEEALAEAAGD